MGGWALVAAVFVVYAVGRPPARSVVDHRTDRAGRRGHGARRRLSRRAAGQPDHRDRSGSLTELTLALILFADASTVQLRTGRERRRAPTATARHRTPVDDRARRRGSSDSWFPSISWREAALVAAILAPTDAALGIAVVTNPAVPVADPSRPQHRERSERRHRHAVRHGVPRHRGGRRRRRSDGASTPSPSSPAGRRSASPSGYLGGRLVRRAQVGGMEHPAVGSARRAQPGLPRLRRRGELLGQRVRRRLRRRPRVRHRQSRRAGARPPSSPTPSDCSRRSSCGSSSAPRSSDPVLRGGVHLRPDPLRRGQPHRRAHGARWPSRSSAPGCAPIPSGSSAGSDHAASLRSSSR